MLEADLLVEPSEELEVSDMGSGFFDWVKRSFRMMVDGLDVRLVDFSKRDRFDAESLGGGAIFRWAEVVEVGVGDEVDGFLVAGVLDEDLREFARLSR